MVKVVKFHKLHGSIIGRLICVLAELHRCYDAFILNFLLSFLACLLRVSPDFNAIIILSEVNIIV